VNSPLTKYGPLWIGYHKSSSELVRLIEIFATSVGLSARKVCYENFPIADGLAGHLVYRSQETVVWLLPFDAPNRRWVERESRMQASIFGSRILVFVIGPDGVVVGDDGEVLPAATSDRVAMSICQSAFPDVNFHRRRVLVVEEVFTISHRGVVLTPGMDLCHLVETWPMPRPVEIRPPSGPARVVDAYASIPRISPMPEVLTALLSIPGVTKEDIPPGSEVWLTG
jgi:hypothetical protein